MKTLLIAAAALAIAPFSANAADLYSPPPAVDYVAPAAKGGHDWTGLYFGVHGGWAWDDSFSYPWEAGTSLCVIIVGCTNLFADGSSSVEADGPFAGVQIGYNWQINNFVLGVETDIAWADIDGGQSEEILGGLIEVNYGSKVDWFGTARLRAGFLATDRLMLFATGGFAYGGVEHLYDVDVGEGLGGFGGSTSKTQTGWAAGGGFEYAITNNLTFKTEYLYVDLGDRSLVDWSDSVGNQVIGASANFSLDAETSFHTVKIGLNYGF